MRSLHKYYYSVFLVAFVMLTMLNANAQNDQNVVIGLKEKFNNYIKSYPREEVFVHTDREEYIAGEEAFFTGYVINRQTFKSSTFSKILYVELLNTGNIPVLQKKFIINDGLAPGSMKLPDTLSTGAYRLIAYTSWMKNFLPDNCFSKDITIYNLLKNEKAAIRQLTTLRPANTFPRYLNTGVSFNVNRGIKDSIILEIEIDEVLDGNTLHLVIQNRGNITFASTFPVKDENHISLPATVLQSGINQVTLFSSEGKPVSEKLLFCRSHAESINIQCNDTTSIREEVSVRFSAQGSKPISGRLSLSVSPGTVKNTSIVEYMLAGTEFGVSYAYISGGSEIEAISERVADSVLSGLTSNWINWNQIVEGDFPECRYPMENEYHYLMGGLQAKKSPHSDFVFMCSPGKDAYFRYALCDEKGRFSIAMELDNKLNDYIIIPEEADSEISIESPFISHDQLTVIFADIKDVIPKYIPKWSINYQVNKLYEIKDTSLSQPERSRKGTENKEQGSDTGIIRFYGKPDFELVMDDYINLPVMEEVFFEILPNVSIRNRNSKREIIITDRVNNMPYQSIPCLMIDGVIIRNSEWIINLDPEFVEKIDVIKQKFIVGKYVFPGIVNVITRKGDFTSIELPSYMERIAYTVTDIPSTFALPDTQKSNPRIPDYRNTLYWNPLLIFKDSESAEVSFSSSDNASDYTITIQGVTEEGALISDRKVLKVVR